jgi:hypothetical protein
MAKPSLSQKAEFMPPLRMGRLLEGFSKPALIAGGWAIDLFLGTLTRSHKDLEIAILRDDQETLRSFLNAKTSIHFTKIAEGQKPESWTAGEWLALPIHEVHAQVTDPKEAHGISKFEILINESQGHEWLFRRDTRIKLDLSRLEIEGPEGLKLLNPAVVLLYKSRAPRAQDEADFKRALPALSYLDREWLKEALRVQMGTHPWIERLNLLKK